MAQPATAAPDDLAVAVAHSAATELARLLPSAVPLDAVPFDAVRGPGADAVAVRAGFVGGTSADLVVVVHDSLAAALSAAGAAVGLGEALRPALEAAAATLGPGVLDQARTADGAAALLEDGVAVVALAGADGVAQAWFGLRTRQHAPAVPHQRDAPRSDPQAAMRLLQDVEMTLTAEIGRTRLPVRQVLELVPGTVLELDRAAGSPADVMVNGRLVARGEVVVVDEEYGIRITEIVGGE